MSITSTHIAESVAEGVVQDNTVVPFIMVPHAAIELIGKHSGPTAFYLYCALRRFVNFQTGVAWPGHRRLAALCGINKETVGVHIKRLEENNVITVYRDHPVTETDRYVINDPSDWTYEKPDADGNVVVGFSENGENGHKKIEGTKKKEIVKYISRSRKNEKEDLPSPSKETHEVGPKGRPLNPRYELLRRLAECRKEEIEKDGGIDLKMRMATSLLKAGMTPDDMESLYNYVYDKWLAQARRQGRRTLETLPTLRHLKELHGEWLASERTMSNRPKPTDIIYVYPYKTDYEVLLEHRTPRPSREEIIALSKAHEEELMREAKGLTSP